MGYNGLPGDFLDLGNIVESFYIKENSTFADFGSGSGAYVLHAMKLVGNNGKVYAIDVQKDLLLKLKQTISEEGYSNVEYIWCDFENVGATKIANKDIDISLLSNTLFQLEDKTGALKEIYRTLKNNGKFYIIDWKDSFNGLGPHSDAIIDSKEITKLAEEIGFKFVENFEPGPYHYGLEFNK